MSLTGSKRRASGGHIDRSRPISFTWNGKKMQGFEGDSLASALIANGVGIVGRSFKYHRPRGFMALGAEDPNAMVSVRDAHGYTPSIRAGQMPLAEGMEVRSVTGWPSASFDIGALAGLGKPFFGAGFYYKTMMWPNWSWFEPIVRRATGFGRPDGSKESRAAQHQYQAVDVLVVGAGPAGLAAAQGLIGSGLSVLVAEQEQRPGGSLLWEEAEIDGKPGIAWAQDIAKEIKATPGMQILTSTLVAAAYDTNIFTLVQSVIDARGIAAERHITLHAKQVILASGAVERPLLFADNDRPGVMLAGAVRRLIRDYGVAPCKQLVVKTSNDSGWLTAFAAQDAGIKVVAILDTRPRAEAVHLAQAEALGIPVVFEAAITAMKAGRQLRGLTVSTPSGVRKFACDGLAVAGGWTPLIHLACHRGAKPVWNDALQMFTVPELPQGWQASGGVTGCTSLTEALGQSLQAAAKSSQRQAKATPLVKAPAFGGVSLIRRPSGVPANKVWIDHQNDVKLSDVEIAVRENYVSVEHLKRYTTLGMGTDQGRTSNVNGLAMLAHLTGREISEVGITTFRPMVSAIRMGTIAGGHEGDLIAPRRYLPADAVHRRLGADFEDFGWQRPDWYHRPDASDRDTAVALEMAAVRSDVGIFDGSSLGKVEVTGPDAAAFLARFYVSDMATLKPGSVRYSVMLNEEGVIYDDGVVACLGPNHYLAGPTSGHAEAVAAHFERWRQTEWPSSRVAVGNVTSNWCSIAVAGPRARHILAVLNPDFDISPAAFKHMQVREGSWQGIPLRVARVSFTGELQFEISVPSRYAEALYETLLKGDAAGAPRAIGMEAWLRLRLEKGYIHLGSDTNGRTGPTEVGMAALVAKRQDDFIGKRSLTLPFALSDEREQLVGLVAVSGKIEAGARVLAPGCTAPPCKTEGYVTSGCDSPTLGHPIGLALIERGFARQGEEVTLYSNGRTSRARITSPVFYDPENERLRQ
ncbi:2Fe-2S iron-sulfur cluster-binding protein [Xinfangfangia sp. CPCC 101601]|uniref:2Fe-2S iron-sulfur cluster-binding protein n=1 Tax=Pseudogemmobacter lacusdianii TaxID=3069608 RepID=A0ABU0W1D9_9RHOB|nr:2Fe-2S iron-sulfur cluster-binding protein [Xinfangfangia sp. CPCC 101601]MDQ2067791.1 2Fe-2S iron-sulfur cluster-binding protein [Xinfangfangia sp. CPCC 101601]